MIMGRPPIEMACCSRSWPRLLTRSGKARIAVHVNRFSTRSERPVLSALSRLWFRESVAALAKSMVMRYLGSSFGRTTSPRRTLGVELTSFFQNLDR